MKINLFTTKNGEETTESIVCAKADNGVENEVLNIYDDISYQEFEGFGGALTDAAGYIFSLLNEEQKEQMLDMYFNAENMGYNRVRIHMDSCDFSTKMYEAAPEESDENLEHFSFADTEKYIIPLLKAAEKKAGKKLKIMLSPWSPPAYMKTNGSRVGGGSIRPEYRKRWASYLCRYIKEFKNRGFEVERISVQNEPKAAQTWDSCQYTSREEKEFLRDFLVPELKQNGLDDIEVFIWDHNKERIYERAKEIIDETTTDMITGVAYHWYSGDHFEALDLVRQQYPDKKLILSESCLEFNKFEKDSETENAERLAHDMIGNLNHGMNGFYDWNILLDSTGGPNHVQNLCDAPFLYDIQKQELEERVSLKYYRHFAQFIKPGAVRVAHSRYTDKLDMTVWKNPDGQLAVILLNRGGETQNCYLRYRGEMFEIKVEGHTITSGVIVRE